jgi:hypothetical protein
MIEWLRKRSLATRVLVYASAATLAFAVAAGVGATTALMLQGDLSLPGREEPRQPGDRGDVPRPQHNEAGEQENAPRSQEQEDAAQQSEAEYVARVGDIQDMSVEAFLDSHDKLMRYDALTADDIEEMQANQAALKGFTDQVDGLDPPQKYREQYEMFSAAINELYEATKLAYSLAADPIAATKSEFDEHDRHVDRAAAGLQRSNEILGRDYKTIEGAHMEEISPI